MINWDKNDPAHTQRIAKGPKLTYIDEIIKLNKSPEKSSPSPHVYMKEKAWAASHSRVLGTQKLNDIRTTFVMEKEAISNDTPGHKYKTVNTVSFSNLTYKQDLFYHRTLATKISEQPSRWEDEKAVERVRDSPSPNSY